MTPSSKQGALVWKGESIDTLGQLVGAISGLEDQAEAQAFIAAYRAVEEHADANAGYCTGYLGWARGAELRLWMGTAHPVFGP